MEETKRRYEFDANLMDVRSKIVERLGRLYSTMSLEKRIHLADGAITDMLKQGNDALQQGLVLYGVQIAREECGSCYDE